MNKKNETVLVEQEVFKHIMDGLKANIYVTDVNTDEIIFMNKSMKEDFGMSNPEGKICWKVLQQGKEARCEFCPIDLLKQKNDKNFVYEWNEINSVTRREYRNYDCLLKWVDGRLAHLQQSIDVTELIAANTDDLTHFYTRKLGKNKLEEEIEKAKEDNQPLTLCLLDINLLKEVNDTYGHAVGDRLIVTVADTVRANLLKDEFAFRLSGDEFVVVFKTNTKDAQKRTEKIRSEVEQKEQDKFSASFSFGFAEFTRQRPLSIDDMLFFADKRMYEQKKAFHIRHNKERLQKGIEKQRPEAFEYDQEKLYDALVMSTDDYIYVCNMRTGVFKYSLAMIEDFGLPQQVIANAAAVWGEKVHPDDKAAFLEANQEITDGRATSHCVEYRALNCHGEWVWVRCRGHLEVDENNEPVLFAGFITNLGKKNKIDNLTGLFNKLEFKEQAEQLIAASVPFALMLLGIDNLKHINDLYNRSFGDEVIRIVSQRLQSLLPDGVDVYRLDGDVFGVIARNADAEDMKNIYSRVCRGQDKQQLFEGKKYHCTLSGGCAFYPNHADGYEELIKFANYSLEFSKNNGKKRCTYFSKEILDERARSLALVELLRESVENQFRGFRLVYQPVVHAFTGEISGIEALARWECAEFGNITPLEFIPLLESSGLIGAVGSWIINTTLKAAKKWTTQKPDFLVGVNLSYLQMHADDFIANLRGAVAANQFNAKNLVLELTESYFATIIDQTKSTFQEIKNMGMRVAMDDFGTGYSTLGILKDAPADIVKIDKTFIRNIESSSFDATFIRFVVELCHNVGIEVCLEGVEDTSTYDIVKPMGLDYIQGYLFDKPLEENQLNDKYFKKS